MPDPVVTQIQETFRRGTGDPEGIVDAPVGTVWLRDDGGIGSTLYVKESGANTVYGWQVK